MENFTYSLTGNYLASKNLILNSKKYRLYRRLSNILDNYTL